MDRYPHMGSKVIIKTLEIIITGRLFSMHFIFRIQSRITKNRANTKTVVRQPHKQSSFKST